MGEIHSVDVEDDSLLYRYEYAASDPDRRDEDLDEDEIADYITDHFEGNCLIAAGDEDLIKIHFHTNEPWKVLEYCNSIGEIYDIVVEDMMPSVRRIATVKRPTMKKKSNFSGSDRVCSGSSMKCRMA